MIYYCGEYKLYTILWCGRNKSDELHNKGPYHKWQYKLRSFALRFCASNHKSTWQPLLPFAKGLSFILVLYFMQESRWSSPFLFTFYPFASTMCWKDPDIYIANWIWVFMNYYCWHYPWGKKLGGKTISPYLSLCPIKTINIAWVLAIVKD